MGVGFGGYFSVCSSASLGPYLCAVADPTTEPPVTVPNPSPAPLPHLDLVGYPHNPTPYTQPMPCQRDIDYSGGFDGWLPQGGVGYWQWTDTLWQSGIWVDTTNKTGMLYFPTMGDGFVHYCNAGINSERGSHYCFVYDPADLATVAQGANMWSIQPKDTWKMHYPDVNYSTINLTTTCFAGTGCPGQCCPSTFTTPAIPDPQGFLTCWGAGQSPSHVVAGVDFDSATNTLYLEILDVDKIGCCSFPPRIYAYQVSDTVGTPTATATQTYSATSTQTPVPSLTATTTASLTYTRTSSQTPSASPTFMPSLTSTQTPSPSLTYTRTYSFTQSPTFSQTLTASQTSSPSLTSTRTYTFTQSPTFSQTLTSSQTSSPSLTSTGSYTFTPSPTFSQTLTPSQTSTSSLTATKSYTSTQTATPTVTPTSSNTYTPSLTTTPSFTMTPSMTLTSSQTFTSSPTCSPTASESLWIASHAPYPNPLRQGNQVSVYMLMTDVPDRLSLKVYTVSMRLIRYITMGDPRHSPDPLIVYDGNVARYAYTVGIDLAKPNLVANGLYYYSIQATKGDRQAKVFGKFVIIK